VLAEGGFFFAGVGGGVEVGGGFFGLIVHGGILGRLFCITRGEE
jgi:hypothetical protein